MNIYSPYLTLLRDRIDLKNIPFSERGSRLLVFHSDHHLSIRLAERWFKRDGQLSAYRQRPPILDDIVLLDSQGELVPFDLATYPHCLELTTRLGQFTLTFLDSETLLLSLPAGRCGISMRANLDRAEADRRGGVLRLTGDIRRNIAYTTNARVIQNDIQPDGQGGQCIHLMVDSDAGQAILVNITPRLGFNRYVPNAQRALENAAQRWHDWFSAAPPVLPALQAQYYYAWWIMRAGLISSRYYTTREAMTPSKIHYVGVWQWDAYFHALAYRHLDAQLACDQLRILLDHQREDGMIPDAVHDEGVVTHLNFPVDEDVTKPPLLAWAAWKIYEQTSDREFLDEIYHQVVRWNRWWYEKNDPDGSGLCVYRHPFSSGLDDSPLWDQGMPVVSPDLNTYLYLQQEALARIAAVIDETGDVDLWQKRAAMVIQRMLEHLWDEEAGLFWATHEKQTIRVRTPFNLFPLITGQLPPQVTARLIGHLTDPRSFWPRYPVPSVALDDPHYNPQQMWRGPTWVNVNYLLIEGLARCGYVELARQLRQRTIEMILSQNDIYEYYHPENGEKPPKAASIFGWSSAIFIDLAIQASREV